MVIDIPRSLLIREPWTTITTGGVHNIRPLIVSVRSESPVGQDLVESVATAPDKTNTFRVVDGLGPCYEFEGSAALKNDVMTVHVNSTLKFLR